MFYSVSSRVRKGSNLGPLLKLIKLQITTLYNGMVVLWCFHFSLIFFISLNLLGISVNEKKQGRNKMSKNN